MSTYRVVRYYRESQAMNGTVIKSGVSLEEAQAWCNDPESSSVTATSEAAQWITEQFGPWFDGYEDDAVPRALAGRGPARKINNADGTHRLLSHGGE